MSTTTSLQVQGLIDQLIDQTPSAQERLLLRAAKALLNGDTVAAEQHIAASKLAPADVAAALRGELDF